MRDNVTRVPQVHELSKQEMFTRNETTTIARNKKKITLRERERERKVQVTTNEYAIQYLLVC